MKTPLRHTRTDWAIGGLMFVLCVVLTFLQYRWTGDVARAEVIRMRSTLDEQARNLTRAFDAELNASSALIFPATSEFAKKEIEEVHRQHFKKWNASHPRPVFRRIGLAVGAEDTLKVYLFDPKTDQLTLTNWPTAWRALEENLENKWQGRSPPFRDNAGFLQEHPIFSRSRDEWGHGPGAGEHWVILELDADYLRNVWLPELVTQYLNPDGSTNYDVRIRANLPPFTNIYSYPPGSEISGKPAVSILFNNQARPTNTFHGPKEHGGRMERAEKMERGVWMLEVQPHPGALEAAVAAARWRNLGVAVVINLLMLATGIALLRQTRRARQLADQQINFVANVSHELRTPLTVIRGAAYNIQRGLVQERARIEQYSGLIIRHTEQLTDMIEQLLQLAGARKNQTPLNRKNISLKEVVSDAVTAAESDTLAANCKVEVFVPCVLPEVSGDAAALRRVFQNLISNAARHGGDGKWIGITASAINGEQPPMVEVRVADHGLGIPEAEQGEIFKPFVRGAAAEEKQVRGSGLGLSLVKEIVEAHGGRVALESKSGKGATFIVQLPVSGAKSAE